MFSQCAVSVRTNSDIEIHHIRKLFRKVEKDGKISVLNHFGRRIKSSKVFFSTTNRKQLVLCKIHHLLFKRGEFYDLYASFLNSIYNSKISKNDALRQVFMRGWYEKDQKSKLIYFE